MGPSLGGYYTLMALAHQPGLWRAGVDMFGIADLRTFLKNGDQVFGGVYREELGELGKDDALLGQLSPISRVNQIAVPLFVYAGQNDTRVPRSESDMIVEALRQRGMTVEYMVAPNEGHSIDHIETKVEFLPRVIRFLTDAMK